MKEEYYEIPGICGFVIRDGAFMNESFKGCHVLYNGCGVHDPFRNRADALAFVHKYAKEELANRIKSATQVLETLQRSQSLLFGGDPWGIGQFQVKNKAK